MSEMNFPCTLFNESCHTFARSTQTRADFRSIKTDQGYTKRVPMFQDLLQSSLKFTHMALATTSQLSEDAHGQFARSAYQTNYCDFQRRIYDILSTLAKSSIHATPRIICSVVQVNFSFVNSDVGISPPSLRKSEHRQLSPATLRFSENLSRQILSFLMEERYLLALVLLQV